ncbi:MAG: hypothetical protein IPJ66_18775 [Bacteroidetes bacterium]|nr:hypothetical protein [Bacteroidota bacterium]
MEDSADGSMLAGIYLTGDIYIGDGFSVSPTAGGVGDVKSITITRCNIGSVFGNYSANGSCCGCYSNINLSNYLINENVIRGNINGVDGNGNLFANNIIEALFKVLVRILSKIIYFFMRAIIPVGYLVITLLEKSEMLS